MSRKIVDVKWFSGRDCIGIVLVETQFGLSSFIGVAAGHDAEADASHIADWGSRFPQGPLLWPEKTDWALTNE